MLVGIRCITGRIRSVNAAPEDSGVWATSKRATRSGTTCLYSEAPRLPRNLSTGGPQDHLEAENAAVALRASLEIVLAIVPTVSQTPLRSKQDHAPGSRPPPDYCFFGTNR